MLPPVRIKPGTSDSKSKGLFTPSKSEHESEIFWKLFFDLFQLFFDVFHFFIRFCFLWMGLNTLLFDLIWHVLLRGF